ncbi:hypothetical protein F5876DRAFT_51748 [Lentinula aff. lateritia]|uniref:Uncharacterized protein n=1 Tax=Lentinula aff. lateritia TaxID=2804960 RepID=A0ACC1TM01_9AGAR|nr:hypothetical protein F5876DRAFT_51748 [Lentinula aff. lateritia]
MQVFERRVQISTTMMTVARGFGDDEEYHCWSEILYSLDRLGVDGMSDNEEILDSQGQQGIAVYEPDYWNPGFSAVYDRVDEVPQTAKHLFSQVGRKRLPRIRSNEKVKCPPPAGLPRSYYRSGYLERMENSLLTLTVDVVSEELDRPIPRS